MNSNRFDTLTKSLATRFNRRSVLRTATAGAIGGLVACRGASAGVAQGATPVTSGAIDALFVQSFEGGSLVRDDASTDDFTLTLEDVAGTTVYFSDRPERVAGLIETADFVDDRVFSPSDPPNAALAITTGTGQDVLIVELRAPRYDATARTVTYDVQLIDDYEREGFAFFARQQTDQVLDETFAAGSLFVDQVSCKPRGGFAAIAPSAVLLRTVRSRREAVPVINASDTAQQRHLERLLADRTGVIDQRAVVCTGRREPTSRRTPSRPF
ncbi:MAG: hypothetical protein M3457_15585 [Chloroflexota bacterium]|nr:hypothetical protein [Chloroflexota bacterium]